MVFPPDLEGGGGEWRRSEHAHASYPGLFFRPPGFSPYMGREERRVQRLDYTYICQYFISTNLLITFLFVNVWLTYQDCLEPLQIDIFLRSVHSPN